MCVFVDELSIWSYPLSLLHPLPVSGRRRERQLRTEVVVYTEHQSQTRLIAQEVKVAEIISSEIKTLAAFLQSDV